MIIRRGLDRAPLGATGNFWKTCVLGRCPIALEDVLSFENFLLENCEQGTGGKESVNDIGRLPYLLDYAVTLGSRTGGPFFAQLIFIGFYIWRGGWCGVRGGE